MEYERQPENYNHYIQGFFLPLLDQQRAHGKLKHGVVENFRVLFYSQENFVFKYEGEVYKKAPQGYGVAYYEHSRGKIAGVGGWQDVKDTVTISGTWHKGLRHGVCIEKRQYW